MGCLDNAGDRPAPILRLIQQGIEPHPGPCRQYRKDSTGKVGNAGCVVTTGGISIDSWKKRMLQQIELRGKKSPEYKPKGKDSEEEKKKGGIMKMVRSMVDVRKC